MGDRSLVQVSYGEDDVSEQVYSYFDAEETDFVEILEESAAVNVFKYQIDVPLLLEETIELDYLWVIE